MLTLPLIVSVISSQNRKTLKLCLHYHEKSSESLAADRNGVAIEQKIRHFYSVIRRQTLHERTFFLSFLKI